MTVSPLNTGRLTWLLAALLVVFASAPLRADFNELLRYVPDDANALVMVNSQAIYQSPYGKAKDLAAQYLQQFAEMPMAMPPKANQFVVAAEMDVEFLSPQWEVAVASLDNPLSIDELVAAHAGMVDTIRGKKCCVVNDLYIVQFSDKVFGMMWPARRHSVADWIEETSARSQPSLPDYLAAAARYPIEAGTEIVMALDLDDAVSPAAISKALGKSAVLSKAGNVDTTAVASVFTGLRGIMLGVKFTDRMNAKLRVDFDRSASALQGIAKPLILESLRGAGALLPDFADWSEAVEGNSASITGVLTAQGARQLVSLLAIDATVLQPPAATGADPATSDPPPADPADPTAPPPTDPPATRPSFEETVTRRETKSFVNTINQCVTDLKSGRNDASAENYLMYLDRYARKIDRLPATRVDAEIAKLGKQIGQDMNSMVAAFHDGAQRAQSRQNEVTPDVRVRAGGIPYESITTSYGRYYRYAPFGWAEIDTASANAQRQQITSEELQYATQQSDQLMQQIDQSLSQMHQLYQQKFGDQ